ncbi:MAG: glycosyltransferase family 4 protein [Planctomyces sp.]|nr:glycosyltransferase family 4 protein [Planctomyces sp.]
MPTRILFINRSYWPDTEATGQLLTELCEDLAADGEFDVHVLCGRPNHVSGAPPAGGDADVHNGVTIHRIPHTAFSKRSTLGKLTNLVSFTLSAWWNSSRAPKPDIVITETDPFFLGLLGKRLKRKFGCRFVAYLQDLYPDVAVAVGKARETLSIRRLRRALFGAYAAADRVVVLSRDMRERCAEHGVDERRIDIIPNWADVESLRPLKENNEFRRQQGLSDEFVVMYSGNMGLPHLLTPILDAAEQLNGRPDIRFLFVGEGVQKADLDREARQRGLENVRFLSYQPKEFLSHSLSAADVQIVSVKPGVIACLMPSKLYGILAAGCSVLAIAPRNCEMSELIAAQGLGEVCDFDDPAPLGGQIADAIQKLCDRGRLADIVPRARKLAVDDYSRALQVRRFRELFRSLIAEPASEPSRSAPAAAAHS